MRLIAIQKVVSGALQGVLAALVVLPLGRLVMGPIPGLTLQNAGLALGVTLLGSGVFASLGLLMGTIVSAMQIGLMFSIVIAPMLMFGCAYYPWRGLDAVPFIKYGVLVNPLVYVAEGMRGAITPSLPHMPLPVAVGAMAVLCALFLVLGIRQFERRAMG
ncbi:MAG: ABC transporter permease [Gemmatimonadaceae bacterium]